MPNCDKILSMMSPGKLLILSTSISALQGTLGSSLCLCSSKSQKSQSGDVLQRNQADSYICKGIPKKKKGNELVLVGLPKRRLKEEELKGKKERK